MFMSISQAFTHGGIWMYAILGIHIVSLAIIAERTYYLFLKRSASQKKLTASFENDIKKGQIETALNKANSMSKSQPLGTIAFAGIQSALNHGGKDEIQAKMQELINVENEKLEKRTNMLSMIANVSTLVGLLGTITGMIKSFSAVSSANAIEKATLLSNGISEAMNCTAYGLIVAVPALIMYTVLNNRAHSLTEDLNQAATKVFNWLNYSFDSVPKRKSV